MSTTTTPEVAFYRQVFGWEPLEEEVDGHHYPGSMDPDDNDTDAHV